MAPFEPDNTARDYLVVDRFMGTMIHAEALATAFEIGMVDCLISRGPASSVVLAERLSATPDGVALLLDILIESGVVAEKDGACALADSFLKALCFRDLMEARLFMARMAAQDLLGGFVDLVTDRVRFMDRARFHRMFAYDRCFGTDAADRRATARWMRITTVLTRYEAAVCMARHDFSPYRRLLDVGGNSGEFALRLCRHHAHLGATVFDLPLVCEAGMAHVGAEPEVDRIAFVKGNALADAFPAGHDLVVFKSMLHDWPDDEARQLIQKAARALSSGGRLLIFERARYVPGKQRLNHAVLPFLIFFHSYRAPAVYADFMKAAGFSDIQVDSIDLEMPFMLITGRL